MKIAKLIKNWLSQYKLSKINDNNQKAEKPTKFRKVAAYRLEAALGWARKQEPVGAILATIMTAAIINAFFLITKLAINHFKYPALGYDSWRFIERDNLNPLQWLLAQHNEHRIFLSKLATLIETNLFQLPVTSTSLLQGETFLIISSIIIFLICKQSLLCKRLQIYTTLSSILILINPWQYENLYWEFQTPWLWTNLLVLGSSLLLISWNNCKKRKKQFTLLAIGSIIPWAAIYGIGQGIAVAASLCICSLFKSTKLFLTCLISTSSALALYFIILPYEKPTIHPSLGFSIDYLSKILLGGPWQGLAILVFTFAAYIFVYQKNQKQLSPKQSTTLDIGILLPGIFAIIFGIMTTLSRSGFGTEQATSSRYLSHSLMLAISGALIVSKLIEENTTNTVNPGNKKYLELFPAFAVTATTVFSFPQVLYGQLSTVMYGQALFKAKEFQETSQQEFTCRAASISLQKQMIKPTFACKGYLPTDPRISAKYFNDELQIKPWGWHKQVFLDSKMDTNTRHKKLFTYSIDNNGEPEIMPATRTTDHNYSGMFRLKGWAFVDIEPKAPIFLIAEYLKGDMKAYEVTINRADIASKYSTKNARIGFDVQIPIYNGNSALSRILLSSKYGSTQLPISINSR